MMIDCGFNYDQCQDDQQRNVFCRKPADDEKCRQHDHQNREDDAEHGPHANDRRVDEKVPLAGFQHESVAVLRDETPKKRRNLALFHGNVAVEQAA